MNLFSKFSALLVLPLLLVLARPAAAIHLHALYTASCQRELGIILDVGPRRLQLLNLEGKVVDVERFEVIYYASFSVDVVPMHRVTNPEKVPLVEVKTFQNGDLERLVLGWPVDFNKDKISFLNLRGSEVVIDRASIWSIDYMSENQDVQFQTQAKGTPEFVHPYAFSGCPLGEAKNIGGTGSSKPVNVYPQTLLSDPVSIKREFDRLEQGHKEIGRYIDDQQFYPVPEVYHNETTLGLWGSAGARYGASKTRSNNFTPYLVNEFSGGPFGFQSIFTSGSGPMLQTIHEEIQTQIYYRMKADYFHFSGMVDPNLLLVGSKYQWAKNDLGNEDMRAVEDAMVEFGFDYGKFSLELYLAGIDEVGAQFQNYFARRTMGMQRLGLVWQGYRWKLNLIGGSGSVDGYGINFFRGNVEWTPNKNHRYVVSLLQRNLAFNGWDNNDQYNGTAFTASSKSTTGAFYGYWRFKTRYWAGVFAGLEQAQLNGGSGNFSTSKTVTQPKGGALISLAF